MVRLRPQVTTFDLQVSSDDEEEEDPSADDAWQPGSREGSDAEDGVAVDAPADEPAARAPRRLSHEDLACALQQMPATHQLPPTFVPEALTQEWAFSGGLSLPALVAPGDGVAEALGMRLPPEVDAIGEAPAATLLPRLLCALHPSTPVPIIDVATQSESAALPLADFLAYFASARREYLLNVVSLSLAGTPLEATVCAPRVVREADLVARAWPAAQRDSPSVQLYALASPAGCVTDWHLDFGGSSVWYRVLAGSKVFALAPPTKHNLRAYVQWASSSRQTRQFLGDALEDLHKYTVRAGELLLIPGGWPHAVFTPEDSVVVGGNFVHAANLGLQCLVWRIEDRLRVEASYRYPNFKALCWYAAQHFCGSLPPAADEDDAVAKAERAVKKRLHVKLLAGDDAAAEAGADAAEAEAGGGALHFILSALKAEEDKAATAEHTGGGSDDVPATHNVTDAAADCTPVAAAEQASVDEAAWDVDDDDTTAARAAAAAASESEAAAAAAAAASESEAAAAAAAAASESEAAGVVADDAAALADAAAVLAPKDDEAKAEAGDGTAAAAVPASPTAPVAERPSLSLQEMTELAKLCAQLSVWLEQGRDDELQAGVPVDVAKPRSLLARLQARLRAAGLAVQHLADEFDDAAEDITNGGIRLRFRLRKRTVEDPTAETELPLPAELRDDVPHEKAQRVKPSGRAAAPKQGVKRAAAGVRDRLAKKLGISTRR